jgi:hypothetical protein
MVAVSPSDSSEISTRERSSGPARDAAAQFAGMLIQSAFRPLATALGFYGDLVVASVAQSMARDERSGLTGRFAALLERSEP